MKKVVNIRNKIIVFEIIFLFVMFFISYKIYKSEEKLMILSKERSQITFNLRLLRHELKELFFLSKNYVITKNKDLKEKYFDVMNNGDGLDKKIKITQLLQNIEKYSSVVERKTIKDSYKLLDLEQKAIELIDKGKYDLAKQIALSEEFQTLKSNLLNKVNLMINNIYKKIDNLVKKQKNIVYNYFILLASLGTLYVFINIYFFIYLTNLSLKQLKEKESLIKKVEDLNENLEEKVEERTQEIKKLMKVKSEFLANMSHEIRTPLNAMFGFIRILEEKDLDDEAQKYLTIIEKSGKNLLTIINDILDFSKIEAGKLHIEKIEFNPREEIEVIHNLFKGIASEKDITLEINENFKYNIISDPVRIKQVIANLLSNAIKFTESGHKVILNINYNAKVEQLYVEVKDEGIGIPKEKLAHIFEAFSQADNSTTRKYGGTGLGLTISHKLIELLGGELKVKSEVGKGSIFYFTIPAKKTTEIKNIEPVKRESLSKKQFNGYLLLVEDNMANQMFMKVIMEKMGLDFDIANDGIEAVERFKNFKYDVILMDENMPNMNGIEATKKIREIEKEKRLDHTIIIALTANAMEGDKERFISAGMDYYLSKPLDVEKLQAILEKL